MEKTCFVINFELTSERFGTEVEVNPKALIRAVFGYDFDLKKIGKTYVARVCTYMARDDIRRAIFDMSDAILQDCIAVKFDDGTAELIGPYAEEWGEFNPKFFIDFPRVDD